MHQEKLFFEDQEEALRDTIRALGGAKVVGHQLKPHMKPDAAGRWLNDTLNDARPEVLCHKQFLLIAQMGRHAGVHNVATQFSRECGYADPIPVDPDDEAAQLQKDFIRSVDAQKRILKQMERLASSSSNLKSVPNA
jgi:hypothetical protein